MTQAATGHGDGAVPADQAGADAAATESAALGPAPAETTPADGQESIGTSLVPVRVAFSEAVDETTLPSAA